MASKAVVFFAVGVLFGGLGTALVGSSLSETVVAPAPVTQSSARKHASLGARQSDACPTPSGSPLLPALAKAIVSAKTAPELEQRAIQEAPPVPYEVWTQEQQDEFLEHERELYRQRRAQVKELQRDLMQEAGLNGQERRAFTSLIQGVQERLSETEIKIEAMMGPTPIFDPSAPGPDENEMMDMPEPPRLALLQAQVDQAKALLEAQTRYESLLGPERIKALGPRFSSVEVFIQPSPWPDAPDDSVKGG